MKTDFFKSVRPLLRIAVALERIARALEHFAVADARNNKSMYSTAPLSRFGYGSDASELMHSDPATVIRLRAEEHAILEQRGYQALEEMEDENG